MMQWWVPSRTGLSFLGQRLLQEGAAASSLWGGNWNRELVLPFELGEEKL